MSERRLLYCHTRPEALLKVICGHVGPTLIIRQW